MKKARVYGFVPYDRSGKVNWAFEELGVPYEWVKLDHDKGEHISPAHLARNPMGAIPVLELDGITMRESDAIVHFLAERFPGLLPEIGSPARAECLQWFHFSDGTLGFAKMARFPFLNLADNPADAKFAELKKGTEEEFQKVLNVLERHLENRDYLCGNFSIADIAVAYSLAWTEFRGDLKGHPSLVKYLARNKARPAALRAKVFERT